MRERNVVFIYGLADPATGEVRYVGKADDLARRLSGHLARPVSEPMRAWLLTLNGKPEMRVLEECAPEAATAAEDRWIEAHRATVLNQMPGGFGGKRKGAGRPAKHTSGPAVTVSLKLAPELAERLRAVAAALETTQAAVCEMGVRTAERKLHRRGAS